MKNICFTILSLIFLSSCSSKEDLKGNWVVYEVKSSFQDETKIRKLDQSYKLEIVNDTLALLYGAIVTDTLIGKVNTDLKTIIFPSDCCSACFEYELWNNKLKLSNYLGTESFAHKEETAR